MAPMKAAQISEHGGSEVVKVVDVSAPTPKKGQILVRVHASSINPFDWKLRSGVTKIPLNFPMTLGGDYAGVAEEVGEDVPSYKKGDEVYGSALVLNGGTGSFAEYAAVNTANTAHKPKNINFEEAGSLPLVGASAIQALEDHIKLKSDQKILIHGGAGGIGSIAVQLAKSIGAYVATTVSGDDIEFVKSLGADEVIDYKNEKFEEKLKEYDAVFDTVGGDTATRSFQVLKKEGVIVSMVGGANPERAKEHGVTAINQGTETNAKHLTKLTELVEAGKIKPLVDKIFSLDQIKEAFDYLEKESPAGKVVVKI